MVENRPNVDYDLVYADPPWKQSKGGLRECRPNQTRELDYKTLSTIDISKILSVYDSPVLFMWTIDKYLHEAENIAKELGYKLHARIKWDKMNGIAPAFTIRFTVEYLLWFYKSPMMPIAKEVRGRYTDVIREKSTKHSKKPLKAYEMIESMYPNTKKIELFARNQRDGWDAMGDELQ